MDLERIATEDDIAEVRGEVAKVRLDNARQTRQLTLTILIAFLAQFAATTAVIVTVD